MLISLVSCPFIFRLPFISPLYEKGTRPFIQFDNVLLPDPDGPTIRTFSPSYIVKFILLALLANFVIEGLVNKITLYIDKNKTMIAHGLIFILIIIYFFFCVIYSI